MPRNYHVGQRLSFESALCTVRYIGLVEGTQKEWLGVEWDDPSRGKHDGEHKGKRYFTCRSLSKTAASFVRPTRTADPAQSFVEAVHQKYGTGVTKQTNVVAPETQIMISGAKFAEEVGFDKIRAQLAQLHELKIVLVDGLQVDRAEKPNRRIRDVCPKIVELDLSRNLFESCSEIIHICGELDNLRTLKLNGNRLQVHSQELVSAPKAFSGVKDLELDEMLLPWKDICLLAQQFESLKVLTASSNGLESLNSPLSSLTLTSLTLEYNQFTSLSDLAPLSQLASLENLLLKGNQISTNHSETLKKPVFGSKLQYVDLSYNQINGWAFIDDLAQIFPGMTGLRLQHNPVYDNVVKGDGPASNVDDGFMLVLARLGNLKSLNFSPISDVDRRNAEMFYLSRIGKEMASVPESEEHTVTSQHKRYAELCEKYDKPDIIRKGPETINPDFLEARLIKFTFYMSRNTLPGQEEAVEREKEIPKGFDIYRVKGIVGRLFDVKPLYVRLVWETGEYDPVAGYEEEEDDSSDDEVEDTKTDDTKSGNDGKGKWMKREVEIVDSTRQVGYCVEGTGARVRVEVTQV